MSDHYHIRVRKGHHKRLRFWFAPVSPAIMNADADWLEDAELSCDNICTKELFFQFIEKHFPGDFQWRNEINLMPFANVLEMTDEVRKVTRLMKKNYNDPRLRRYKKNYAIDLLVNADEYDAKYLDAPESVCFDAIEEHKDVIIEFYTRICDYLEETIEIYKPKGFDAIAICAPH